MAFIDRKDPLVLNIKLTSKGRELLAKGRLTFSYYAVGDSEIDYEFNRLTGFDPFYSNILRPADKNPQQLSFIPRNLSGDPYNEISAVPVIPTTIENKINAIGFFNGAADTFLTDTDHVKQPDAMVKISGVTGGTTLELFKAPTYQATVNEPVAGDFILVKWTNPQSIDTTGHTINVNFPTPFLWYKIQKVVSGTLANNNLVIEVDRDLPNFSGMSGSSSIVAGALVYYNYINYTGDTCYETDETDDAIIAFLENCQCPTVTFPFWNMSIIFTENVAGVQDDDKQYGDYNSKGFGGFVSYIQNQAKTNTNYIRKLGVIHYTNNSVANTYAEGLYGDPNNPQSGTTIPTLDIPTIMWHLSSGTTLGLRLRPTGTIKYLTGGTYSLNTRYYDLADQDGNVVGKAFYDLKIFLIEDQELLFALSYKSNRSWTLPEHNVDINANVTFGCPACLLDYTLTGTTPTTIGGSDGTIIITGITNITGDPDKGELVLEILSGDTGQTGATQIFFNHITGDTIITNQDTINSFGLSAITYTVKLTDTAALNQGDPCTKTYEIDLSNPVTTLSLFETGTTFSGLNALFRIGPYASNPLRIRLYPDNAFSIGYPLGTAYFTIVTTATTENNATELTTRAGNPAGTTGNDALSKWVQINSPYTEVNSALSLGEEYVLYFRDATGNKYSDIQDPNVISAQTLTYYKAYESPFEDDEDMNVTKGSDGGGDYAVLSSYIGTTGATNPVVGEIEVSLHPNGEVPTSWVSTPNDGSPVKIYAPAGASGIYEMTVRERFDYIIVSERTADDTVTF